MLDYSELLATSRELLDEFGGPVVLHKVSTAPADASKPWRGNGGAAESSVTANGVLLNYKLTADTSEFLRRGNRRVLVEPPVSGEDLRDYTVIVIGAERWQVEECTPLNPAGTVLLYEFRVRL